MLLTFLILAIGLIKADNVKKTGKDNTDIERLTKEINHKSMRDTGLKIAIRPTLSTHLTAETIVKTEKTKVARDRNTHNLTRERVKKTANQKEKKGSDKGTKVSKRTSKLTTKRHKKHISWKKKSMKRQVKLVRTRKRRTRARKLNIRVLDQEFGIMENLQSGEMERELSVESVLAGDNSRKEFQVAIESMLQNNPFCGTEDLTRNGLVSRLVHRWHKQGILKFQSALNFQRKLLRINSGVDFWDSYEDSFLDRAVTSDMMKAWRVSRRKVGHKSKDKAVERELGALNAIQKKESQGQLGRELRRAKGSSNLKLILANLSQDFVSNNFHEETIRRLKGGPKSKKHKDKTPLEKVERDLTNFCNTERSERRLGKFNYLGILVKGLGQRLHVKSQGLKKKDPVTKMNHAMIRKVSKQYLERLARDRLILETDKAIVEEIVKKINRKDKQKGSTHKKSTKQDFLEFIQKEASEFSKNRKLILDESHHLHTANFVSLVQKELGKLLKIQSDKEVIERAYDFVKQKGHQQKLADVNKGVTHYLQELTTLGDISGRQKTRLRNLARAVALDSYISQERVSTKSFFTDLRKRLRDKTLKQVVEAMFLHFLKQSYLWFARTNVSITFIPK